MILEGIELMLYGMGGIFIVTGIVYIVMKILGMIDKKFLNK